LLLIFVVSLLQVSPPPAADAPPALIKGFDEMYNLSFDGAHRIFETWAQAHPSDPEAPVFDAAAYLFSEFDHLQILQSEFFLDDRNFTNKGRLTPDPQVKMKFDAALEESKKRATAALAKSPFDRAALFATVMRLGLHADYLSLIEKRELQALSEVKDARQVSQTLLDRYPDCYDAYIAVGTENYLLSQKAAPVRWILRFGGAQTDKDMGIAKLTLTATKGQYLRPYAELLLAVAALRDKNRGEARRYLSDLATRFPGNRLYREELKKLS
jgi:hypothetical protein